MPVKPVIHVGVDASWRDTGALEWALQESLLRHEPLQVMHVIGEKSRYMSGRDPDAVDDSGMEVITEVQKYLDGSVGSLDHEADLVVGPPARTLTELATDSRMLVVGRRGMGTFKRLLIGSTSEAITNHATVPVVVVPERWKPADHASPVIVAVDDSDGNETAIEFAITAATERSLPVRLLHVWDLPAVFSWDAPNSAGVSAQWAENAERHLENLVVEWREKHPQTTLQTEVRQGHPVDGIVTAAAEADAQLLVIGMHHHTRLTSILLGAVSRGVLQYAGCPVAIVPTHD